MSESEVVTFTFHFHALEKEMENHSSVLAWRIPGMGEPGGLPSPSAGDLRELPRVPLRGEGSCGGGGAPRDSAGSGATEEGLTSTLTCSFPSRQQESHMHIVMTEAP